LPAKNELDDDDVVKIELDGSDKEEDVVILNEKAKPIKGKKLKAPRDKKTFPDKKTLKKKEVGAARAPKRKLTTDDTNEMDVDEVKPKRIRDFKWLTTLDKETQEEINKRQTDQDNRTLYIYDPTKPISDEEVKALSSDIIFVQRKRQDVVAAFFLSEEICKANYNMLSGRKEFKVRLHLNERKPKPIVYGDDVKINSLKLVVLGLPSTTTMFQLKEAWPHATCVYRDPKALHRAFVYFYSPEIARKAFDESKDKMINGSKVTVLYARSVKVDAGPSAGLMRKQAAKKWLERKKYLKKKSLKKDK